MVNCGLTPSEGIWDLESGIWNQGHFVWGLWNAGLWNPSSKTVLDPLHVVALHYKSQHFRKIEGDSACRVNLQGEHERNLNVTVLY